VHKNKKKKKNEKSISFKKLQGKCWWLTPVILATQEIEIRKIKVQSQPWGK
jgi:hypothetical protein